MINSSADMSSLRTIPRRRFLQSACAAALTTRCAVAQDNTTLPRLRLGVDAYTLRAFRWDALQLLDYTAQQKLDTIQLDLDYFKSTAPEYISQIRERAARTGIVIDGSIGCICGSSSGWRAAKAPTPADYARAGLRAFRALGARSMRVFMGAGPERKELAKHIENLLKVLREVRDEAMDSQIKIAIENHGDFQAWELRETIETAGKDFVGACLDSGNPISVVEDPNVTLEVLGPYVVTTHIRDSVVFEHPRGAVMQWVALGDGCVDFKTFFERFRKVCPNSGVQLEILTGGAPRILPYLEKEFWEVYPKARASEFARFVRLAKNGHPLMAPMVVAATGKGPAEYDAALREQQRVDLERSLAYARNVLSLGM